MYLASMSRPRRKMTCLDWCHGSRDRSYGGDCIILNSWSKGKVSNAPLDAVSEDRARTIVVLEGALGAKGPGDGLVSCELGPFGRLETLIGGE